MCGIVAKIKRTDDGNNTARDIVEMYEEQKTRGQEGYGFVAFDDELNSYVRRQTGAEIKAILDKCESRSVVFHHRLPTSTPNYSDCAHPIRVSHKELKHDYYLIHNGMISNCSVLKEEHDSLGYQYTTKVETRVSTANFLNVYEKFNDSESLAIDVARYLEGKQDKLKSRGSIAFIAVQIAKKTNKIKRIFWGRNSSPLKIEFDENELILRSESNFGENVKPNKMYCLDLARWEITEEDTEIGIIESSRNYSGFFGPGCHGYPEDEDDTVTRVISPEEYLPDDMPEIGDLPDDDGSYAIIYDDVGNRYKTTLDVSNKINKLLDEIDDLEESLEEYNHYRADDTVGYEDVYRIEIENIQGKLDCKYTELDSLYINDCALFPRE